MLAPRQRSAQVRKSRTAGATAWRRRHSRMRYDWERWGTLPPTVGLVAMWYTSSISIIFTNKRLLSGHAFAFPFFMTACNNVCRARLAPRDGRAPAGADRPRPGLPLTRAALALDRRSSPSSRGPSRATPGCGSVRSRRAPSSASCGAVG